MTAEGDGAQEPSTGSLVGHSRTRQQDLHLGCLTKKQLVLVCVAGGVAALLVVSVTAAVVLSKDSGSSAHIKSFATGGDMLDFLVQSGAISEPDGLLATWFHRANSKEAMNEALAGDAMILEADVTLEGYGTPSQQSVPIMAHPPDIYSDNTLDQWLDAVLASPKGIKLDFKALGSVDLSLELLSQKNRSRGINRPVWLNADILQGPNVPEFLPPVNGTRFLQLIQEKFPDVTVSPGWKVAYGPPIFIETYSRSMVEDMYDMIKDVPQKEQPGVTYQMVLLDLDYKEDVVTFPVHALLVQRGWPHISWLLSQSPRFSLTLWQGSIHPNISDLLFVRDNSHPARVYYDIYEPTLTAFKQAAMQQGRLRRFYPGGDLMDFLHPDRSAAVTQHGSLEVRWFPVSRQSALLERLSDQAGGMLVLQVGSDRRRPGVPVVGGPAESAETFTVQDVLTLLQQSADASWGVYLRVQTLQLLEASLDLLRSAYGGGRLYRPVWVSLEASQLGDHAHELVSAVEGLFPSVTLVLTGQKWPPVIPAAVARGLSQRVALHLSAAALPAAPQELRPLLDIMDEHDVVLEEDGGRGGEALSHLRALVRGRTSGRLYVIAERP